MFTLTAAVTLIYLNWLNHCFAYHGFMEGFTKGKKMIGKPNKKFSFVLVINKFSFFTSLSSSLSFSFSFPSINTNTTETQPKLAWCPLVTHAHDHNIWLVDSPRCVPRQCLKEKEKNKFFTFCGPLKVAQSSMHFWLIKDWAVPSKMNNDKEQNKQTFNYIPSPLDWRNQHWHIWDHHVPGLFGKKEKFYDVFFREREREREITKIQNFSKSCKLGY